MTAPPTGGSWPAFYACGDNILWINGAGKVVNGDWRPTFSEDRLTCWHNPREASFTWVGSAPYSGSYNDVIERFRQSRAEGA